MKLLSAGLVLASLAEAKANPIRRVVTLLQEMGEEIEAEIEKEKKMYTKFECYCKKNDGALDAKAKEAAALIKKTRAEVEGHTAQKKALAEELKKHQKDREDATKRLEAATAQRTEEKTKYDDSTKEVRKTLEDIDKAVVALERGMGKSFLQTGAADYLRTILNTDSSVLAKIDVGSQSVLASFLQNSKDYAPASGEIVGILKQMKESINEDLGGIVSEEEAAVKAYLQLKLSLEDLIKTSGLSIEKKAALKGQVAVKIVEGKNLISTTEKQMGDDMRTLMQLKEACADKGDEFNTRQADAQAEVAAINEAVGMLNNDDALQLFNKTDTKDLMQTNLLQRRRGNSPQSEALAILVNTGSELKKVGDKSSSAVAMLAYSAQQALKNKKAMDFTQVLKMIDDMVSLLKNEADDDLAQRDSCNASLNDSAADKKEVERAIEGLEAQIEELQGTSEAQAAIVAKSEGEIAAAKTAMAEATQQRQDENAEFVTAVDLNKQAVGLIQKVKNRLNAYYNPQLVPSEAPVVLSAEEEVFQNAKTVFIQLHQQSMDLPEGQPDTWEGADRKNKGQKGASVLALMDMLATDLNKDTQALEHDETTAQKDYEKLQYDLSQSIAESTKSKNDAAASKANAEADLQTAESTRSMKEEELADVVKTIADLHAQCDFIIAAFEERKAARENEISGLGKAKAILAGANFE
jgi:chromosome segregation ATPase